MQQLLHFANEMIQIQHFGLENLAPAEDEQLARESGSAVRSFVNLLAAFVGSIGDAQAIKEQFAVALDDGEEIVEVVSHASGKAAQCFHFLGLAKLLFELVALGLVALQSAAHAVKRASDFSHFPAAAQMQTKLVVAFLQRFHALYRARREVR